MPFYPEGVDPPENEVETQEKDFSQTDYANQPLDIVDGRPAWYDPIFTEMFIELRMRFDFLIQ